MVTQFTNFLCTNFVNIRDHYIKCIAKFVRLKVKNHVYNVQVIFSQIPSTGMVKCKWGTTEPILDRY